MNLNNMTSDIKQETDKKVGGDSVRNSWIRAGAIIILIVSIVAGFIVLKTQQSQVYMDSAYIDAPIVSLTPAVSGILQNIFVREGDEVSAHTAVAQVGTSLIKTKTAGIIVVVPNTIGALVSPATAVVSMIDPSQLRVVGKIDEDKGLNRMSVGDRAMFTVDAYSSKKYVGVVDEVSPISAQSGIVFNISDKRETKQFIVKVRFDSGVYPELKNGMSARIWVYIQK